MVKSAIKQIEIYPEHCLHSPQVADQYAFIPREAISKFLLFCIDCQRKNSIDHRGGNNNSNNKSSGGGSVTSERSSSADSPSVMDVGGVKAEGMFLRNLISI